MSILGLLQRSGEVELAQVTVFGRASSVTVSKFSPHTFLCPRSGSAFGRQAITSSRTKSSEMKLIASTMEGLRDRARSRGQLKSETGATEGT